MDRKGLRKSSRRPGKPRKRRFTGNQHTFEEDLSFTSASAVKLKRSNDNEILIDYNFGYCILEFCSVFSSLALMIICATCKQKMSFSRTAARGLGFKIGVQCGCTDTRYIQSCPIVNKSFEINRRIVTAMRLIGIGIDGINRFCSIMDIGHGLTIGIYYSCLDNLHLAASTIYNSIISKAVKEENDSITASNSNADPTHFTVFGDGTWKKRGFNSLFGVTTLVGKYSKKVIDTVVKSSFCQGCNDWKNKKKDDISAYKDWYNEHEDSCAINPQASAGKMEVDAVVEMFSRSEKRHGVKYVEYIGDGDSKTFEDILNIDPYKSNPVVIKKKCGSETQNNNESLNSLIWTFAPKHIHAGSQTIEMANCLAVCIFNEGFYPILRMMSLMGIKIGLESHGFAVRRDPVRIERPEVRASDASSGNNCSLYREKC